MSTGQPDDVSPAATHPADVSEKRESARISPAEAARRLIADFARCDCGCGECYPAPMIFEG